MTSAHDWWVTVDDGIQLTVRVVPGARRSEIVGVVDGVLKVKVTAPPVDGQANAELERVIAKWLGLRVSAVTVTTGLTARAKTVHARGVPAPPKL